MSLKFHKYDIQWPSTVGLPEEATIRLPDELVEITDIEEDQWHEAVNDQLQRQFGERGGFIPDDRRRGLAKWR